MVRFKSYAVIVLFTLCALQVVVANSFKTPRKQKILVIHSYHQGLSWTDSITEGIKSVFPNKKNVEIHFEYLDTKRNYRPEYMQEMLSLYKRKLFNIPFKVIIVSDDNAFNFIKDARNTYYPNIPIVFCGINQYTPNFLNGLKNITGVSEEVDFFHTIQAMLKNHPFLDTVLVIDDQNSITTAINKRLINEAIAKLKPKANFIFLKDLSIDEIVERVSSLNGDKAILLNNFTQDKLGSYISFEENIQLLRQHAKVPIYSTWDFYLGEGIVGGMLTSGFMQGQLAGSLALKILSGVKVDSLPVIRSGYNSYMFDQRQLARFGINPTKLPPNSTVVNQTPSFIHRNRHFLAIVLGLVLISISAQLTLYFKRRQRERQLLNQNVELERRVKERTNEVMMANQELQRQKAQIELQNSELENHRHNLLELVEERTSNLEQAHQMLKASHQRMINMLDASSEGSWEYDFNTNEVYYSPQMWNMLGYKPNQFKSLNDFIEHIIHPEDIGAIQKALNDYTSGKNSHYRVEYRLMHKNGSTRWFLARGKFLEMEGERYKILVGTHSDITSRREAEQKLLDDEKILKSSESRWRSLYEQASEAIILLNEKAEIVDYNTSAKQLFEFESYFNPNIFYYLPAIIGTFSMYQQSTSTDARLEKNEYVLSLNSGVEIPVDINISKIVVGEKAVYMLMIRDIRQQQATEREILNAVIETEERERKRFSTDLHDTIGPLLSALNLYITALNRSTTSERHNEAFTLAKETLNETLKSIREISNNLSPQSLTDFGLGVALKNFVQRLNLDENLQINLDINLGATRLPAHLEVGFYRIATELINNTMKYANASLIHLEVYTYNHFAKLDYRDNGIGFSSQEVAAKGGHGIPNISSRVRSMNGKFRLWSRKGKGVRITVETPIYTPNAV